MKTVPYMYFNGNAAEAIKFYERVFQTKKPEVMLFKEMPGAEPDSPFAEKILHAEIEIGNDIYYISDVVGAEQVSVGNNLQINLNCDSEDELRRLFSGLSDGATITMPIENTFWDALFAGLTDKFGISWTLNFQKKTTG